MTVGAARLETARHKCGQFRMYCSHNAVGNIEFAWGSAQGAI
jgi:hypothetical protein